MNSTPENQPNDQRPALSVTTGSAPSTFDRFKSILAEMLWMDESKITLQSLLDDDLGVDSLDAVELMMSVEANFRLSAEIGEEDAIACKTVADAVALIDRLALPNTQDQTRST